MMKNSKLKISEYMQNISRSKSYGKFVLIVKKTNFWRGTPQEYFHVKCLPAQSHYFLSYIFLTTSNGAFLSSGYFLMGEWRVKVLFSHFLKTFCKKP